MTPRVRSSPRPAFTLIELLTAVAIIAILASLLLTALGAAKQKGRKAACINNLKQIGVAIQLYCDDHQEQLPGPVWQGFYDTYDNVDTIRLSHYIASQAGYPAPTANPQTMLIARCPATAAVWRNPPSWMPAMALQRPLSYILSIQITNVNSGIVTRPFGYPYSHPPFNSADEAPKRVREILNPALSWAVTDADKQNAFATAGYYPFLPATPSHGANRNQLFFDWHIESIKAH